MTSEDSDMDSIYSEDRKPGEKPGAKPKSIDEQEAMNATQLMDKKAFPDGCEVGERYEVEVVADHGEEVEIKVVKPEETPEKPNAEPKPDEDSELAEMDKQY